MLKQSLVFCVERRQWTTIIEDEIWNYSLTYFRVKMKMKLMIEKYNFRMQGHLYLIWEINNFRFQ